MSATPQCYRHRRGSWIASCPDCTAWHLADAVDHRDTGARVASFPILPRRRPDPAWAPHLLRPAA